MTEIICRYVLFKGKLSACRRGREETKITGKGSERDARNSEEHKIPVEFSSQRPYHLRISINIFLFLKLSDDFKNQIIKKIEEKD